MMPALVKSAFDAFPAPARQRLLELRDIILEAGQSAEIGEIEECLKWGQPSYLPRKKRVGTTVRLGWSASDPDHCRLFVPCQTSLVDSYRERFAHDFRYEGNRAVLVPVERDYPRAALAHMAVLALTYHRTKGGA